jgi:hypothetical protein
MQFSKGMLLLILLGVILLGVGDHLKDPWGEVAEIGAIGSFLAAALAERAPSEATRRPDSGEVDLVGAKTSGSVAPC